MAVWQYRVCVRYRHGERVSIVLPRDPLDYAEAVQLHGDVVDRLCAAGVPADVYVERRRDWELFDPVSTVVGVSGT